MKKEITKKDFKVAYLSMEIAFNNSVKTFCGGLGILAGDILLSASELSFPMIGITLFSKEGYFKQKISKSYQQEELDDKSDLSLLTLTDIKTNVNVGNDQVLVRVWSYFLTSNNGMTIPIYLLDTDWPENKEKNRLLSHHLYGGDIKYRLKQEIILGRAGIKIIKLLGYDKIEKIHLNEGHAALATVELLSQIKKGSEQEKINEIRKKIVFTTHTPIKEAHDVYFDDFLLKYQPDFPIHLESLIEENQINFSNLIIFFSSYINAVSKKHATVSREMFPGIKIDSITNGVNSVFWTSLEFASLFDKYISGWKENNCLLRKANIIPLEEIDKAHKNNKEKLINFVNRKSKSDFSKDAFTIVFARRFAPYKRPLFLLHDIDRLIKMNKKYGPIQIIYAGKAHPRDVIGKTIIAEANKIIDKLSKEIKIVFLPNYDMDMAKILTSGSDLWLNNPILKKEASATSGMKAAHNGVPQLSTLDGWWPEGYHNGLTGWNIKEDGLKNNLYDILEKEILPLYYKQPLEYLKIRRNAISLNASMFNTQRVLREYIKKAYKM